MNTFTFTDDEIELLVELVATADDSDQKQLVILSQLSKKLERKPKYIIGECGGPELDRLSFNAGEMIRFSEDSEREQLIRQAITNNIGGEGWRPEDLIDRVRVDVFAQSGSIYYLDDKPILEIYNSKAEITRTQHSEYINSSFGYKFL